MFLLRCDYDCNYSSDVLDDKETCLTHKWRGITDECIIILWFALGITVRYHQLGTDFILDMKK